MRVLWGWTVWALPGLRSRLLVLVEGLWKGSP